MQNLNQAIADMRKQLTDEVSKREQESIRVSNQLASLERKMESVNDNSIRHEQSLISLKDSIRDTKDDLRDEIRELKTDINQIDKTFNSIKTWAKILAGIIEMVGGIIGGVATGGFLISYFSYEKCVLFTNVPMKNATRTYSIPLYLIWRLKEYFKI